MSGAETKPRLTEAQFVEQERQAEFKSEFFDGEAFARAGGTRNHALIATDLKTALHKALEHRSCLTCAMDAFSQAAFGI